MTSKRIIALYGTTDVGKTTTLNILIDLFLKVCSKSSVEVVWDGCKDRYATIFYEEKIICICTAGDTPEIVEENTSYFSKNKFSIAICPTRCWGNTRDALDDYADSKKIEVERIKKNDDLASCGKYAAELFYRILTDKPIENEEI